MRIYMLLVFFLPNVLLAEKKHDHGDSLQIYNFFNAGRELFFNGMYPQALDSFKISLKIGVQYLEHTHPLLRTLNNAMGITYGNIGDFNHSLKHFLDTERSYLADKNSNPVAIARLYTNIGNVYSSKLNYGMALDYYNRAVEIIQNQSEPDREVIAGFFYSIANIYYHQNNYTKVIEITEQYFPDADADIRLLFVSLKAASLKELDRVDEAYEWYKKSIEYAIELNSETDIDVLFEYISFANFLISVNNFKEANEVLEKLSYLLQQSEIREGVILAFYHKALGAYYRNLVVESMDLASFRTHKSANLSSALMHYNKGLEALGLVPARIAESAISIENTHSLTQCIELLKLIADTYLQMADIYAHTTNRKRDELMYKSLDYYEITAAMIQQARKEIYSDENKIQLNELEEATFLKIVQTAYYAYEWTADPLVVELAFLNAERMKAGAVFDHLSGQLARENSLIPDSLTERERNLNYNITRQNEILFNLHRTEDVDSLEIFSADSILFHLKRERDELSRYLETNYSEYYDLKYNNITVTTAEIQKMLKRDEVLLEYVLNENDSIPELFVFCLSKKSLTFHRTELDADFFRSVERTFRFMSETDYLLTRNDDSKAFCIAAHYLYKKLVHPFAEILKNKKLIIVPDGKLHYIPFDALLTEMPDTTKTIQFNHLPYLIRDYSVRYAYSANLLYKFSNQKRKAGNRLLLFAPEYNSDTVFFEGKKHILSPLPGIRREAELISKMIRSRTFTGEEASEMNFRKYCEDYDILHLAMHAFINDSLPAFSRFAFTQNFGLSAENDGWLNTADIYTLNLNARLSVLSACNTGGGTLRKGEGVMSLARGFIYAGCPVIVMTLWDVEDNAGTTIMHSFYRNLKKGLPTDDALRLAKLNYLGNANPRMAHPHYWLGYVTIGNSVPLFMSFDIYFLFLLVLVVFIFIADHYFRIKRYSKR